MSDQIKVGLKFCGGCRARYDRAAAARRMREALSGTIEFVAPDSGEAAFVLVICGCETACADTRPFAHRMIRFLTSEEQVAAFIKEHERPGLVTRARQRLNYRRFRANGPREEPKRIECRCREERMSGRVEGKTAIITGSSGGIGKAAALAFAREGASLVLADLDGDRLAGVRDEIASMGASVVMKRTDVASEDEVKALVDLALSTFGAVDVVVNNAGIPGGLDTLENQSPEEWHKVFDVNVMGAVYATKHVIAHMKHRRRGSIVNVASVAGIRSGAGGNAYSASKAALINFTQTSACEVGEFGVRINAVCPGLIETTMTQPFFEYARKSGKLDRIGKYCELRRAATPGEVATAILFLASDEASYITGQALPVDGGISASLSIPGRKI
jgi:NAD(P)-dependent dehydrogenase (short-subunit alcohol dehydrogenase family)